MMSPWTYGDYKKSVERNVVQGTTQMGFTIDQSIGYAHNELTLRLEEHPDENVLALTAIAISAHQRGTLSGYASGDELFDELKAAYKQGEHLAKMACMSSHQGQEFQRDAELITQFLGLA